TGPIGILAGFLVGIAFGAAVEVIAYLVSRYFGLRSFGFAYGVCFSSFVLAGAIGTYLMGAGFDRTRSYTRPLIFFLVLMLAAALLFTRLGPYRFAAGAVPKTASLPVVREAASRTSAHPLPILSSTSLNIAPGSFPSTGEFQ